MMDTIPGEPPAAERSDRTLTTVEASLAAIIASTMPLLVALSSWLFLGERLPPLGIGGLAAGFAGVALIMGTRLQGGADPIGVALCVIGVVSLTVATLSVRGASSGGNVLMIVGLQMLVGAAALIGPSLVLETWELTPSWQLAAAFAYVIFFPGLIATLVWFLLVRRVGATRAATFHFLNPFFGVAIAALLLGERMGWADLAGVAIIMAGILAVQLARAAPVAAARAER
jgi:drug/metabolite transporter (DMT)-like permease